jgi:cyclomaltodextrinase
LTSENIIALVDNKKILTKNIQLNHNNIAITLPIYAAEGKKLIRLAVTKEGRTTNFQHVLLEDGKQIDNNSKFNWHDGIIYSLMIDRFNDGDKSINQKVEHDSLSDKANYMGGDLQGVVDKLNSNYFDNLGINTIWISPVYDNPNIAFREYPEPHRWYSGYHGYWPISSTRVEEKFGDMDKLKELIDVAHKHDIKILLDFVSNHVHKDHPYYRNHKDWFGQLDLPDGRKNIRFWDEFRLTTWFEPYLPSYDFLGSETVLDTITTNAVWWLNETGADGFRHDAVKHVPNEFWRKLTTKIKKEIEIPNNTPVYQVGETFGSYDLISSYVNNGQLSAQFNFNLYDVALPTFINKDASFNGLDKEMQKTFSVYGPLHLMSNVMDSHDKNRFMAFADGDLDVSEWSAVEQGWENPPKVDNPDSYKKLTLYMAFMNTIPGLPVIYYGSEFGMTGASDPDNRRMMRFDNALSKHEKNTMEEVSKIIKLRSNHTALRYGDYYSLIADDNIYAYVRSDLNERILVVLNKSQKKLSSKLVFPNVYKASKLVSLIDNIETQVSVNIANIQLDGMSYNIYKIE